MLLLCLYFISKYNLQSLCHCVVRIDSLRLLSLNIKLIILMQKYPYVSESQACILKIFVMILLLSINLLISSGMFSTRKLSKYVKLLPQRTNATKKLFSGFVLIFTYQDLLCKSHLSQCMVDCFMNKLL